MTDRTYLNLAERRLDEERIAHMATRGSLDRVKGQLADLRLGIHQLLSDIGPEGQDANGWTADSVTRLRARLRELLGR